MFALTLLSKLCLFISRIWYNYRYFWQFSRKLENFSCLQPLFGIAVDRFKCSIIECLNALFHIFLDQIYKTAHISLTHTYRGWPTACCLLCTAYLGISLMQGDAMKEQSDANPRCVCVRPDHASLHARVLFFYCCLSMCCYLCHTGLVAFLWVGMSASVCHVTCKFMTVRSALVFVHTV